MAEFSKESLVNIVSDTAKESTGGAIVDTANGKINLPAGSKIVYEYLYDASVKVYKSEELKLNVKMINLTDETAVSRYRDDVSVQLDIQYFDELVNGEVVDYTLAENESIEMYPYYDNEGPGWSRTVYTPVENKPLAYLKVTFENIGVDEIELSEIGLFSSLSIQDIIASIDFDQTVDVPKVKTITLVPRTGSWVDDNEYDYGSYFYIDVLFPEGVSRSNLMVTTRLLSGSGVSDIGSTYVDGDGFIRLNPTRNGKWEITVTDKTNVSHYGIAVAQFTGRDAKSIIIETSEGTVDNGFILDASLQESIQLDIKSDNAFHTSISSSYSVSLVSYSGGGEARFTGQLRSTSISYDVSTEDVWMRSNFSINVRALRNGIVKLVIENLQFPGVRREVLIEIKNMVPNVLEIEGIPDVIMSDTDYTLSVNNSAGYSYERFECSAEVSEYCAASLVPYVTDGTNLAWRTSYKLRCRGAGEVRLFVWNDMANEVTEKVVQVIQNPNTETVYTLNRASHVIDRAGEEFEVRVNTKFNEYPLDTNLSYRIKGDTDCIEFVNRYGRADSGQTLRFKAKRDGLVRLEIYATLSISGGSSGFAYGSIVSYPAVIDLVIENQGIKSWEIDVPDTLLWDDLSNSRPYVVKLKKEFNTAVYGNSIGWRRDRLSGSLNIQFTYNVGAGAVGMYVFGPRNAEPSVHILEVGYINENGIFQVMGSKVFSIVGNIDAVPTNPRFSEVGPVDISENLGEKVLKVVYDNRFYRDSFYDWEFSWETLDGAILRLDKLDHDKVRIKALENGTATIKAYHKAIDEEDIDINLSIEVNISNQTEELYNFDVVSDTGLFSVDVAGGNLSFGVEYDGMGDSDGEEFVWSVFSKDGKGEASIVGDNKTAVLTAVYNGLVRVTVRRKRNNDMLKAFDVSLSNQVIKFMNARLESADHNYFVNNGEALELALEADNAWVYAGVEDRLIWSIYNLAEGAGDAVLEGGGLYRVVRGLAVGKVWVVVKDAANNSLIATREVEVVEVIEGEI